MSDSSSAPGEGTSNSPSTDPNDDTHANANNGEAVQGRCASAPNPTTTPKIRSRRPKLSLETSQSHSTPNASFVIERSKPKLEIENKEVVGEDINYNIIKVIETENQEQLKACFSETTHPCLKRTVGNSFVVAENEVDSLSGIHHGAQGHKRETILPKVGFDPAENRTHRVDVLWRVQESSEVNIDASQSSDSSVVKISDTPSAKMFHHKISRVIPQFQKRFENIRKDGSQSHLEPKDSNDNSMLVKDKKSDEECGSCPPNRRLGQGGLVQIPPNERERRTRREPLTWPWHSGNYQLSLNFHNAPFRTQFSNKVIIMKAFQWGLATVWTLVSHKYPVIRDNLKEVEWTMYIAVFLLMFTFLAVRSSNVIDNQKAIIIVVIYTICIAHISAMMYMYSYSSIIPMILMTLTFTYMLTAGTLAAILEVDPDSASIFYPFFTYTLMTSIISFWMILGIRGDHVRNIGGKLIVTWFPCCLFSMMICSVEMREVQELIRGTRTPLTDRDWILASTFLI